MHAPHATPRPSVFYDYRVHPFRAPPEMHGAATTHPVVIVGAGPIGLATALDLARFGVRSVVLEQELQVSHGSRAIVLTRRSMEILQQIGVADRFVRKGLPWMYGRSFYRGREVYRMVMPHDDDDRFMPGLNLQQQYIEEFLVDAAERSGLIELRWGSRVVTVAGDAAGATLRVDTPSGAYDLRAEWVIAADGGRSVMRKLLGLRLQGRSYPGNFVIADLKAPIDLPTERLCFFDPEWNPGNNVLVHRQPDGIWRFDFRLPDDETPQAALEPRRLGERIELILGMIGQPVTWELDWATVYSANTLTLPEYVAGRVVFVGDAAHLLPIFGVRGANTGLQDSNNLAWKLACVLRGEAPAALLDTYSWERVAAAREICEEAGRSTRFMTPPTRGYRLLRNAVLSFTLSEDFPKDLLHWRTSRPHVYADSPLNGDGCGADAAFDGGVGCGEPLRNVRLGEDDFLLDRIGGGFVVLCFSAGDPDPDMRATLACVPGLPVPVQRVLVTREAIAAHGEQGHDASSAIAEVAIVDDEGRVAQKYAATSGTVYLARPDLHVCARWRRAHPAGLAQAVARALGRQLESGR